MSEHMHQENHLEEKNEAFEAQQKIMEGVREMGFEKYAETLPNLPDAFDLERHKPEETMHRCACCMDGRTPFGIHSAGSGILLSPDEFKKFAKEANLDSISSHEGCGAAKIYAKKMGLDINDSDNIGRQWAEERAKELGVPHTHLTVEQPFHSERVCYYDGTGKFNYKGVEGLPEGFVVGRKFMKKESSLAEVNVAINIIFGDHGFGKDLLTKENPFVLVVVAENEKELKKLKAELEEVIKGIDPELADMVAIDGFVEPGNK